MKINTPNDKINETSKYISNYWDELINPSDKTHKNVPVSNPYITPSKKFNALFYWDTYFQNLGLLIDNKYNLAKGCAENFIDEIKILGFIPNFNGPGWLSKTRSQPAFFCPIVYELYKVSEDKELLEKFIEYITIEYKYWTTPPKLYKYGLTRYYDTSFWSKLQPYSTIAESGWDITNRWRYPKKSLPIDLNTLLYLYEIYIPKFLRQLGRLTKEEEEKWENLREKRLESIEKYMWDDNREFYYDYSVKKGDSERSTSISGFFPLWGNIINDEKAELCVKKGRDAFLYPGGFVTTLDNKIKGFLKLLWFMGLQWCYPIGWAPMQWIVIKGLCNYHFDNFASNTSLMFLEMVSDIFEKEDAIYEKYDVVEKSIEGIKAHYKMHKGFGWTNAVFQALLARIICGIKPIFPEDIFFAPRIPKAWEKSTITVSFKNYPKLDLDLSIEIQDKSESENRSKYIIDISKQIKMSFKFFKEIECDFESILINNQESIDLFNIKKIENSIENKIIAQSSNKILLKRGKNTIIA